MKLINGNALTPTQRDQAEDMFHNRWLVIGRSKRYRKEDDWFDAHSFWAYDDGELAMDVEPEWIDYPGCDFEEDYIEMIVHRAIPYMTRQEMIDEIKRLRGV
jgi:hypothetical protein